MPNGLAQLHRPLPDGRGVWHGLVFAPVFPIVWVAWSTLAGPCCSINAGPSVPGESYPPRLSGGMVHACVAMSLD